MSNRENYIELLKNCIINTIYEDKPSDPWSDKNKYDQNKREKGLDWPSMAHSMIGLKRMENLQFCCENVIKNKIPGDFIECGVWRGGATIFMRGILKAYDDNSRQVWLADSFEGLPKPNEKEFPADEGDKHHEFEPLAISLEEVQENFRKYNLLDKNVNFLKGWFKDTLPNADINSISVLRADGDMYESTIQILENLYSKVTVGGYIIIDDYHAIEACSKAVTEYRESQNIKDEIIEIDGVGVYWQKS
ncbi:UNVERIFIED_CONTAM: hypothetical protein GTU68_000801 [Idotea baltica]|nr:hypothetical protein [Idotea baltica]